MVGSAGSPGIGVDEYEPSLSFTHHLASPAFQTKINTAKEKLVFLTDLLCAIQRPLLPLGWQLLLAAQRCRVTHGSAGCTTTLQDSLLARGHLATTTACFPLSCQSVSVF